MLVGEVIETERLQICDLELSEIHTQGKRISSGPHLQSIFVNLKEATKGEAREGKA